MPSLCAWSPRAAARRRVASHVPRAAVPSQVSLWPAQRAAIIALQLLATALLPTLLVCCYHRCRPSCLHAGRLVPAAHRRRLTIVSASL